MISITIENLVKKFGEHTALDGITSHHRSGRDLFSARSKWLRKNDSASHGGRLLRARCWTHPFRTRRHYRAAAARRNTAMMFQSYALWPHMTVARNVAFGLEERRVSAPERQTGACKEALSSVKMEDLRRSQALLSSPAVSNNASPWRAHSSFVPRALLLDEPLSNLDAKLRLEMRTEIRRVCKESGLTAIYVTHDQKEALSISDRMAILESGKIAQIGRPEEVYRRPQSRVVADFIGETNFIAGTITSANRETAIVEYPDRHLQRGR